MRIIYLTILFLLIMAIILLPLIYIDITITSQGIVRPETERSEIKSSITAYIDSIFITGGAEVHKGDTILTLRKEANALKESFNTAALTQKAALITDLSNLCKNNQGDADISGLLQTGIYRQQYNAFLSQLLDAKVRLRKATEELNNAKILASDHAVSKKELFDAQILYEQCIASLQSIKRQQYSKWQEELLQLRNEKYELESANAQVREDNIFYVIKSPVNGQIQQFSGRYKGNILQAGETICIVSPKTALIAECYISPKDVGVININQPARFQIDAFDYNYFGTLTGNVVAVDKDYTLIENKPVFKVRCSLSSEKLQMKNGFCGNLQKGMTLTARFTVARRTLWQLLFDNIDDWLNPQAPLIAK